MTETLAACRHAGNRLHPCVGQRPQIRQSGHPYVQARCVSPVVSMRVQRGCGSSLRYNVLHRDVSSPCPDAGCGTLNTQPSGLQAKLEHNERQLWPWQEIGAVVAHVKTPNAKHNGERRESDWSYLLCLNYCGITSGRATWL